MAGSRCSPVPLGARVHVLFIGGLWLVAGLDLGDCTRTDLAAHRPLPADSGLAQALALLARAQQDAVWERTFDG